MEIPFHARHCSKRSTQASSFPTFPFTRVPERAESTVSSRVLETTLPLSFPSIDPLARVSKKAFRGDRGMPREALRAEMAVEQVPAMVPRGTARYGAHFHRARGFLPPRRADCPLLLAPARRFLGRQRNASGHPYRESFSVFSGMKGKNGGRIGTSRGRTSRKLRGRGDTLQRRWSGAGRAL